MRCGKGTIETEKETHQCVAALSRSGSDQEGRMKRVELRRRMLRSREISGRCRGNRKDLRHRQYIRRDDRWGMQRDVRRWQYARRLRRNHRLAAVVTLVRRVTGHRPAALHALLILGHRRHAVCELQEQHRGYCQHDESGFPSHLLRLHCDWMRRSMRGYTFFHQCMGKVGDDSLSASAEP